MCGEVPLESVGWVLPTTGNGKGKDRGPNVWDKRGETGGDRETLGKQKERQTVIQIRMPLYWVLLNSTFQNKGALSVNI